MYELGYFSYMHDLIDIYFGDFMTTNLVDL